MASTDRSCFPQVRRNIPRNSFLRNGTWAGSAYATCLPRLRTWAYRHLPFKGCICDDIPVPVAVDGKGWQRSFQSVHPQAKGKDSTALNGCKRADKQISRFPVVPQSANCLVWFANPMANVREEWRGASALSCEICRGITAFGQQHPGTLATPFQAVVLAARRLAPSPL